MHHRPTRRAALRTIAATATIPFLPLHTLAQPAARPEPIPLAAGPLADILTKALLDSYTAASNTAPALAAGILHDRTLSAAAIGQRAKAHPAAVALHDRWHVGSNTKAMTATLAARLIEKGRIGWTSTIGELLPDAFDTNNEHYKQITLWQLLTHRSSIPGGIGKRPGTWQGLWAISMRDDPMRTKRLRAASLILREPQIGKPGETYEYSNLGYTIAGVMLEQAADVSWEQLMQEHLAKPLNITTLGFGPPPSEHNHTPDNPFGHGGPTARPIPPTELQADNPQVIGPAGTAHCSITDYLKFAAVHIHNGASNDGEPFLAEASIKHLHTPIGNYAGGWGVGTIADPPGAYFLSHAGSNTMWFHLARLNPQSNTALVVAANAADEHTCAKAIAAIGSALPT